VLVLPPVVLAEVPPELVDVPPLDVLPPLDEVLRPPVEGFPPPPSIEPPSGDGVPLSLLQATKIADEKNANEAAANERARARDVPGRCGMARTMP
jgi:hypothetical protein